MQVFLDVKNSITNGRLEALNKSIAIENVIQIIILNYQILFCTLKLE